MNILIIAPMQSEQDNFNLALKRYQKYRKLNHSYRVEVSGVGKANAAGTAAIYAYTQTNFVPNLVCVIGYAASSTAYKQGDIVFPTRALYHDAHCPKGIVEDLERVYQLEGDDNCTILTGDSFVDKALAIELVSKFGTNVLFDMEATAIAQIFYDVEVPVLVIKMVSDVPQADDKNLQSFNEFVETHRDFSSFVHYLEAI